MTILAELISEVARTRKQVCLSKTRTREFHDSFKASIFESLKKRREEQIRAYMDIKDVVLR